MDEDDELSIAGFAERFEPQGRGDAMLYLVSPQDVAGDFPDRLKQALGAGPVAAFQLRVKGIDQHQLARLAEPLQRICADAEVAFIVNDDMSLAKRIGADGVHLGQEEPEMWATVPSLGDPSLLTARTRRELMRRRDEARPL